MAALALTVLLAGSALAVDDEWVDTYVFFSEDTYETDIWGDTDTDVPDTDLPDTDVPDTDVVDTDVADTDSPTDTDLPPVDTDGPDTDVDTDGLPADTDTGIPYTTGGTRVTDLTGETGGCACDARGGAGAGAFSLAVLLGLFGRRRRA